MSTMDICVAMLGSMNEVQLSAAQAALAAIANCYDQSTDTGGSKDARKKMKDPQLN